MAGLTGAIVLGLLAALFCGTPTQVSGPTGPMMVIMTAVITLLVGRYGQASGLSMAFTVALLVAVVLSGASVLWLPSGALPMLGAMPTGLPALQWPQVGDGGICAPWGAWR